MEPTVALSNYQPGVPDSTFYNLHVTIRIARSPEGSD